MLEISSFLDRFKNLLTNSAAEKDGALRIISDALGIEIDPQDMAIKNGSVRITGSPVLRSELQRKRELILSKLKENPSTSRITEVR